MTTDIVQQVIDVFQQRGMEMYGSEAVTQLQHAIHAALLAQNEGAESSLVVAALLHDIGHIMDEGPLPTHESQNYDDKHETRAYAWLLLNFGQAVAEPVRLHVAAKRYLCTVDPDYTRQLSPTSLKSYFDQGGPMSAEEKAAFERNPFYERAVRLRRWDDAAKDPNAALPPIDSFADRMREVIAHK